MVSGASGYRRNWSVEPSFPCRGSWILLHHCCLSAQVRVLLGGLEVLFCPVCLAGLVFLVVFVSGIVHLLGFANPSRFQIQAHGL